MYCDKRSCWQFTPCALHAGRAGKSRASGKKSKASKADEWKNYVSAPICKSNAKFDNFYQPIVAVDQWDAFVSSLRTELPVSFRLNSGPGHQLFLAHTLKTTFRADCQNVEDYVVPQSIPWSPLAWQVASSRKGLRHELPNFRKWLIRHFESGDINRQEVVSMVPPLLLQVQPHHYVLDMCAAPGSKTAQLLEALHAKKGEVPSGFVWANDADTKRASLLGHQLSRLNSSSFLVTSHAAQNLPALTWPHLSTIGDNRLLFDRIVCDVPCSGDGTMRKNPEIWENWDANQHGLGLHPVQLKIATRGVQLLAVGGLMTYSTCSFSPLENEAVVAALLARFPEELELVDCAGRLPGLLWSPGVTSWPTQPDYLPTMCPPTTQTFPLHLCMRIYPHLQDTGGFFVALLRRTNEASESKEKSGDSLGKKERKPRSVAALGDNAMPSQAEVVSGDLAADSKVDSAENVSSITVSKFTVNSAVRNPASINPSPVTPSDINAAIVHPASINPSAGTSVKSPGVGAKFVVLGESEYQAICAAYGLSSSPSSSTTTTELFSREQLFVSALDPRKVKLVSPTLSRLLAHLQRPLFIQTLGLRVFQQDAADVKKGGRPVPFRVCQEGVYHVIPHASKRVLHVPVDVFRALLVLPSEGSSCDVLDPASKSVAEAAEVGCLVAVVQTPFLAQWQITCLAVCLLKTKAVLKVYIPEELKLFYCQLLDVERGQC